jgi:putative phage-type endonuclease
MDRLINAGLPTDEALKILKFSVDETITSKRYEDRIEEREKLVDALPKGIEQRTPEWYAAREGLITASNFHKAAAKPEQFIRDKLKDKPFLGSDATRWGVKYEDVANLLYSHYNYTRVIEYGLLHHPTIAHLGASPDGITPYGVMVEVKCPYSKTLKDIPEEYWGQMQGQLFTCGLHECDFIVCRVRELAQAECEHMMDTTFDVARFGSVASFDDGSFKFSRPGDTFTELIEFANRHKADGATITFHHVFDFTVTRVHGNAAAWERTTRQLKHTWDLLKEATDKKNSGQTEVKTSQCSANHSFSFKMF